MLIHDPSDLNRFKRQVVGDMTASTRSIDVFFYGLFMDEELLHSKGLEPARAETGFVAGFALRIGQRAALVPSSADRVYGRVMAVLPAELERLYAEPSLRDYEPIAVLVRLENGSLIPALCYNLPEPPAADAHNPEYAARLRTVAHRVGLPAAYVAAIR